MGMGILGGALGYHLLKRLSDGTGAAMDGSAYASRSKIDMLLGPEIWPELAGHVVADFGSGEGSEAIEIAQRGATRVIGIELQEKLRELATRRAADAGMLDRVEFVGSSTDAVDVVISLDSFEHFSDPEEILRIVHGMLRPGGKLLAAFGPTWFHPYGGHLFSVFPWAHLIFSESALMRWRADFKTDGATRFGEVAGGLNQMTIQRFERIVARSPFEVEELTCVPIRKLRPIASRWNREFTTAIVRARLRRPS